MRPKSILLTVIWYFVLVAGCLSPMFINALDWPQVGCNPQKTAYTPEGPMPPFKLLWSINLLEEKERISDKVQIIVGGELAFFGVRRGVLWAVNVEDGKPAWKTLLGPRAFIEHSPAFVNGLVVQGTLDHNVYAVNALTGEPAWKTNLGAGISVAPLVVEDRIYLSTRRGAFYALNAKDGTVLWRADIGKPILQCAAFDNGRVYFGAEDLKMRCLNATDGSVLWESHTMNGQSLRGYFPVVHNGKVFVGQGLTWQARLPAEEDGLPPDNYAMIYNNPAIKKTWDHYAEWKGRKLNSGDRCVLGGEEIIPEFHESINYFKEIRERYGIRGNIIVLDAETGREAYVWGGYGGANMFDVTQPPAVTRGGLLIHTQMAIEHPCKYALFDPDTGNVKALLMGYGASGDETQLFSAGGNVVFAMHCTCGACGSEEAFYLGNDETEGVYAAFPSRLKTPVKCATAHGAVSISGKRFFHVTSNRLRAFTGYNE